MSKFQNCYTSRISTHLDKFRPTGASLLFVQLIGLAKQTVPHKVLQLLPMFFCHDLPNFNKLV